MVRTVSARTENGATNQRFETQSFFKFLNEVEFYRVDFGYFRGDMWWNTTNSVGISSLAGDRMFHLRFGNLIK